ncbi:ankyrin repeat domain-containing protein [Roseimaritima multifibrata]|uniref:ankyrin repeat domain-containing protein n=1 Tax=Roseimaritima multifibrata TaxID=1930274 RepID=UPI001C54CDFA|nr:ankyrin repeat domain-containing protein [Roseimaritima multifibrata]
MFDAIESHDIAALVAHLDRGGDPNLTHPNDRNWTILNSAIDELTEGGSIEAVKTLIFRGARVDANNDRNDGAPLIVAAALDLASVAKLLLVANANPNVRDSEGDSPLRVSVENGCLPMARTLLSHGATKTINEWGGFSAMTALGRAAWKEDLEMVNLLLEFGADLNALDGDYRKAAERMTRPTTGGRSHRIRLLLSVDAN